MEDEDLVQLAKSIYQKHQRALDFIFEQRPDLQSDLSELVGKIVEETDGFTLVRRVKSYINFAPVEWDGIPEFKAADANLWTKSGHTVALEIRNSPTAVMICVVLGPSDDKEFRERIFDLCKAEADLFKGGTARLYDQYVTLSSRKVLNKQQLEDGDLESLEPKIRKAMENFFQHDLPKINQKFFEWFASGEA